VFEAGIDHRLAQPAGAPAGSYLQTVFMLNGYAEIGDSSDLTAAGLVQAYVKMSRYLGDYDIWAGRRYYQRQQFNMNDYFWLNTAQSAHIGAGIEDLPIGPGKFDLAAHGYEDPEVNSTVTVGTNGTLHSRMLEARYRDIAISDGLKLNTFLSYTARPEDTVLGFKSEDGASAAVWLNMSMGRSNNTLMSIYRQGLGLAQGPTNARPIREDTGSGYDLSQAKLWELANNYQLSMDAYALEVMLLTHTEETGKDGVKGDKIQWHSAGVRPTYFMTKSTSLDQVADEMSDRSGSVTKSTLAFQVTPENFSWSRPIIRLFATHASWSDDFKGLVGGTSYLNKSKGWSSGVQTEVWW
jgi:maltoporin